MDKTHHVHIRTPDTKLLEQVQHIAESPAGKSPEVQEQLATLAKAIGAIADECSDVATSFKWLADAAVFAPNPSPKRPRPRS